MIHFSVIIEFTDYIAIKAKMIKCNFDILVKWQQFSAILLSRYHVLNNNLQEQTSGKSWVEGRSAEQRPMPCDQRAGLPGDWSPSSGSQKWPQPTEPGWGRTWRRLADDRVEHQTACVPWSEPGSSYCPHRISTHSSVGNKNLCGQ